MTTTRRVDGPQSTDATSAALLMEALTAISHACGLVDLDDLLTHFASCWCELTRSKQVIVCVQDESRGVIRMATVSVDKSPKLSEISLPFETDPLEYVVFEAYESAPHKSERPERLVLSSELSPRPIGGVLLWGAVSLPADVQNHLCQCTADLLIRAVESDQLLQDAKLEALGEFAAGSGHEINNPIAAISGRAQLLLRDEDDPQRRQHLLTIGAQALRVRDMIGDTMLFARPPQPEPQQCNLTEVVSDIAAKFVGRCDSRGLSFERNLMTDVLIWADKVQLCVVVSELLRNAIEASPDGGRIDLETKSGTTSDGRTWARLTIRDEGPGLSDESREHLFDPFYSGRQAGRGLGFGLSKCWRIVTNHGGRIDTSESDEGFAITISWPAAA